MAKLYSNENFPMPVVEELRALGHDVATIQERSRANESASDPEVLALASSEQRILLTLNRKDFYRLHEQYQNEGNTHAGILVCVVDPDFQRQAQMIHQAIEAEGDLTNRLIRIPPRT